MLESETPEAVAERRRSSLRQTNAHNFRRTHWPQLEPTASDPVINLRRDHVKSIPHSNSTTPALFSQARTPAPALSLPPTSPPNVHLSTLQSSCLPMPVGYQVAREIRSRRQ